MKNLALIALLFLTTLCRGQNYNCLQYGPKHYFINGNGYLRGIRIDSIRVSGSDTIYYPYHSVRGNYCGYMDSTGGSWLGKEVIQQSDGTFLFDNIWNDTAIIKTQAALGDNWVFFDDTTDQSYIATVTAMDTMTVLGSLDSVKEISVKAYSAGLPDSSDAVNNFKVVLSKHHGFVQVFDLYTFPYHDPNVPARSRFFKDYYLDLVTETIFGGICAMPVDSHLPDSTNSIFRMTSFYNPTVMEIYDYEVGDVIMIREYNNYPTSYSLSIITDTILSKIVTPYSVKYNIGRNTSTEHVSPSGVTTTESSAPFNRTWDTTRLFKLNKLPEEWRSEFYYHYYPMNAGPKTKDNCLAPVYEVDPEIIDYSLFRLSTYRGGDYSFVLKNYATYDIGYGQMQSNYNIGYFLGTSHSTNLVYIKKGGVACGTPVGIKGIPLEPEQVKLFPNPAANELIISAPVNIIQLCIYSIMGKEVYRYAPNDKTVKTDISKLPSGVYLVRINESVVRKFVKQ